MDIRKVDSKGRISGFPPGRHYFVSSGNGVHHLTAVERQYSIRTPLNQQATAYLNSFGLNPDVMCADDHDATGYWRFEFSPDGLKIYRANGDAIKTWMQWPGDFDYEEFKRLSWQD